MVESRENYKFDLGVKGFIKVVKEQVMKLMAIIKQEMQLLRSWQAVNLQLMQKCSYFVVAPPPQHLLSIS